MIVRPCLHCHSTLKANCHRLVRFKFRLRGEGITTCSIRCADRLRPFPLGQRVEADFAMPSEHGSGDYEGTVAGTVCGYPGRKIKVWLDETISERMPIVKLYPDRLRVLDEPLRLLCPECGRPDGEQNSEKWCCAACEMIDGKVTWEELIERHDYIGSYYAELRERLAAGRPRFASAPVAAADAPEAGGE